MSITDFRPRVAAPRDHRAQRPPYVMLRIGDLPSLPSLPTLPSLQSLDVRDSLRRLPRLRRRPPTLAERARQVATNRWTLIGAGVVAGVAVMYVAGRRVGPLRRRLDLLKKDAQLHAQRVASLDDAELAHKVESIVFRDSGLPKGHVSINAENGRVFLRGEVESPDVVARLERSVRDVEGVRAVENLLHLPDTPAPHARSGSLAENGG